MKVTYESLPKKFEEIKQYLTPGTIDAVQATLPIWEFYGDAEFKPSIDDVIALVNNELPDDEPAPAPKPEPKAEEKPKAEPKPKKEAKPKAEKQPKAEKPKKEPKAKAEKQPKEKKAKEKKEPEGEPVAKISPEVAIITRFVKLTKKGDSEEARKTLAALQKMIVNKEIRKTSQYAKEIMARPSLHVSRKSAAPNAKSQLLN